MSFPSSRHAADHALVRRALRGRRSDLEELVNQLAHVPAMVRDKNRRLGSPLHPDRLEDVIQDTLAAVWSKLPDFDGRSTLLTWVYGFCVNELLKHRERNRRDDRMLSAEPRTQGREDRDLERADSEYDYLYQGLERLGPPASEVVQMRHFEQLEFGEIAERLGLPVSTAKTHYYRAVRKLAEWLGPVWEAEQA